MWLNRFKALPRPLRMLVLASFINRAGMFVFPLLAVYLVQSRHLGAGEAGVLISVGSTGLLVGSLLSGPVCGRAGRRAALVSSLLLNAPATSAWPCSTGHRGRTRPCSSSRWSGWGCSPRRRTR